jgi:ribosomal protein L7Ae-like RNA K-turn-binding protein
MARSSGAADSGPAGSSPARPVLNLLGLAARARTLAAGTGAVRDAVRNGKVHRVILASDTAAGQRHKLIPLLDARQVPYHIVLSREELGHALGRNPVSAVGLLDPNLAQRVAELVAALPVSGFTAEP